MSKHGENIRKRKDGRWEGRYIKGRKSDRTAIWGYIYGHSYTEVKEKLAVKKMEVQQFALNVENPTFSELSLTWESSIFLGVKSSTAAHYHYTLQHYILPVLGPYRVQALNESILESSLLEIIAPVDQNHKTLGNAMSKECLTLVRRICRYAVHLHIMRPVEIDLKLPTVNSSNTSVLNNMEQKSVCVFVCSSPTPRRLGMLLCLRCGRPPQSGYCKPENNADAAHGGSAFCTAADRTVELASPHAGGDRCCTGGGRCCTQKSKWSE